MRRKFRKVTAIVLAVCLSMPTLFGSLSYARSKGINLADISGFIKNPKVNYIDLYKNNSLDDKSEAPKQLELQSGQKDPIYSGENISTQSLEDARKSDIYSFDKKEVEELINKGFTVEEIIEADALGNKVLEEPKKILEQKRETSSDFSGIKEDIVNQKSRAILDKLTRKYPEETKILNQERLSDKEKLNILVQKDVYGIDSFNDFMTQYKSEGENALKNLRSRAEVKNDGQAKTYEKQKLSKEYKDKYGLSDLDADGLTDYLVQKLEKMADAQGKSQQEFVKDFIKKKNENRRAE